MYVRLLLTRKFPCWNRNWNKNFLVDLPSELFCHHKQPWHDFSHGLEKVHLSWCSSVLQLLIKSWGMPTWAMSLRVRIQMNYVHMIDITATRGIASHDYYIPCAIHMSHQVASMVDSIHTHRWPRFPGVCVHVVEVCEFATCRRARFCSMRGENECLVKQRPKMGPHHILLHKIELFRWWWPYIPFLCSMSCHLSNSTAEYSKLSRHSSRGLDLRSLNMWVGWILRQRRDRHRDCNPMIDIVCNNKMGLLK